MPPAQQSAATMLQQQISAYFADTKDVLSAAAEKLSAELSNGAFCEEDEFVAYVAELSLAIRGQARTDVFGAGFIAKHLPGLPVAEVFCWWQGKGFERLQFALDAANKNRIDYSTLEWYRVPAESGSTHVCGPFVDFLCNDEYTVTISAPVWLNGEFVGVVAADLLMETIERDLMPVLQRFGGHSVVVNSRGRIVLSHGSDHETGDVYPVPKAGAEGGVIVAQAASGA